MLQRTSRVSAKGWSSPRSKISEQWTSWLREFSSCHACTAHFEIFWFFKDRSDFKDSIRRVLRMNGSVPATDFASDCKNHERTEKGIKNFSIWEENKFIIALLMDCLLSKRKRVDEAFICRCPSRRAPGNKISIPIRCRSRNSLPVRVETRKESIWMRAAPGNRIEERFAFKSKSFRRENVFQLLASRRSSPAVEFPGDCWQFVEMFTPTMESFSQFIAFCARPLKGFAGSRAEIDENIHKMFQFILVCN